MLWVFREGRFNLVIRERMVCNSLISTEPKKNLKVFVRIMVRSVNNNKKVFVF